MADDYKYTYDVREAQFEIGSFMEQVKPSIPGRRDAAMKLLADFMKLMTEEGCFVSGQGNNVDVMVGTATATVVYDSRTGSISVAQQGGKPIPVQIIFDRRAKTFRSSEKDQFVAPVPGAPLPYRSALAELVYATIRMMQAGPAQ